eukprot:gnl/MRDRNA2_/MRDRNA2_97156_c0_seq1.p1 gnl/MRDRNA2_/MRDRNA2_97156_c0~~gnl/MRDRNA2_/MRDRNA2_97156_c0_seq1.p1  ORF type:complete len:142 (-),score=45.91 gnl/MRDRNA2_/MRDRNA2_97156_c0_seq1:94-519(-)
MNHQSLVPLLGFLHFAAPAHLDLAIGSRNAKNPAYEATKSVRALNDVADKKVDAQDEFFDSVEKSPISYQGNIKKVMKLSDKVLEAAEKAKEANEKAVEFHKEELKKAEDEEAERKKKIQEWYDGQSFLSSPSTLDARALS